MRRREYIAYAYTLANLFSVQSIVELWKEKLGYCLGNVNLFTVSNKQNYGVGICVKACCVISAELNCTGN